MNKDEKVANINVRLKSFFRQWIQFTQPFHKLTSRPQQVLALLLYHHYRLKQEITNNKILWKQLFDYDTRLSISEELDMTSTSFENILSELRRKGVIIDGQLSPMYVPDLGNKSKKFTLTFNFNILHE